MFEAGRSFDADLLAAIDRDLFHRGPDSGGVLNEPGVAMVFRRLAILDPDPRADQPMTDRDGRYTIVFNGEIYNYQHLRRDLEDAGVDFRGTGDTEVILEGYRHWGDRLLDRLEGMYAFVIWDRQERAVIAARDPLGIKPLYLIRKAELIGFASEMRPLRRLVGTTPDPASIAELLTFRFAAGRLSNLRGIELLPGGVMARWSLAENAYKEIRFADALDSLKADATISDRQARVLAEEALLASIEAHLQSDVGYAVELSGGIDSSLVTAIASERGNSRLRTYGINLGDLPQDEGQFRQMVVERYKPKHHEVRLDGRDFADAWPRAVRHMEGPTPHFGCVMLMLLCDRIRETDKVVLTGEGADEFFGGYDRYARWRDLRMHGRLARLVPPFLWSFLQRYRGIQRYARHDAAIVSSVYFDFLKMHELFPDLMPRPGAREAAARRFREFRDRMMAVDQTAYLSSLLMRQDKMSMAASVEARVPFAHMPLAKVVNRIPRDIRIPGGTTKPVLKDIADRWLPRALVHRRKVGLNLPIADWLADEKGLGRYLDDLTAPDGRLAAYTDRRKLATLVDRFRHGHREPGMPVLGHLVNMELWLRSLDEPLDEPRN